MEVQRAWSGPLKALISPFAITPPSDKKKLEVLGVYMLLNYVRAFWLHYQGPFRVKFAHQDEAIFSPSQTNNC